MRLKTAKDACKEQLLRGGFKPTDRYSTMVELRLGGDKTSEVYEVWLSSGYRGDWFVRIDKGTIGPGYKTSGWVDWDSSNTIKLIFA